jgi:predicted transcriptional regulator
MIAALQELVTKLERIENIIDNISTDSVKINNIYNDIETRLSSAIDKNIQEKEKLLQSEVDAARKAAGTVLLAF